MARRHESHVDWKHLAVYGLLAAAVLFAGIVIIWSFVERQTLAIDPEPLPKVSVVTGNADSPRAAAWVRLLTAAEMPATLVPIETFHPIEGVIVFCDVETFPPALARALVDFAARGGAIAFAGRPPSTPIGDFRLTFTEGTSDARMKFSETVSPLLSRLDPGHEIAVTPRPAYFLKETPRMSVDARWKENARAAIMHLERGGARYVWFGFDPDALAVAGDAQLMLLLRSAFRWLAGQPVSDGAVGSPQVARTLTPAARQAARAHRFAFSVDRLPAGRQFSVRMVNRGKRTLLNPTVKVWLPPRVTGVRLAGSFLMRRNATLTAVAGEPACLVGLPSLAPNRERVLKLEIVDVRPRG